MNRRPPSYKPHGQPTRGKTACNRLRRVDLFLLKYDAGLLRRRSGLFERACFVDLGYGATPVTTLESAERFRRVNPALPVLGVEIDPERVANGLPYEDDLTHFRLGGFNLPLRAWPDGEPETARLIRAFNVLRQYDEADVADAWGRMTARLAPGGMLFEGTCDEIGRIASWVDVDATGAPQRLTISLRLAGLERPGIVAERLPKALIHRNVPGERVYDLLVALDREWERAAPLSTFGPSQRFIAAVTALRDQGVPVQGDRRRWRLGELTVPWDAVAPAS